MKSVKKSTARIISIFLVVFIAGIHAAPAQVSGHDKIKGIIESGNYIFKANEARPLRGMITQLTGVYDLKVFKDKLIADLPYFGRAFSAPLDPTDIGIKFTSTNFTYTAKKHRKSWGVTFSLNDTRNVNHMILTIFDNGSATLQVNSINRDPITFNGYVVESGQAESDL